MNVVCLSPRWREQLDGRLRDGIQLSVAASSTAALAPQLKDAQILITAEFDACLADACPSLEVILCPAAGTERIERAAVPPGVQIISGTGHEIPMAEYVIGALVALRQRFGSADAALRKDSWRFGLFGGGAFVEELRGSTLGLIGFGRIALEVAMRAGAFGISCGAVTLHPDKPHDPDLLPLGLGALTDGAAVDHLVQDSDAIVVACELSPATSGLVDERRLSLMGAQTVLVNVARGPVVEERALFEALRDHRIAGAALDVWYRYPQEGSTVGAPSAYPFADLDNVLLTPHSSGWTREAAARKLEFVVRRINEWYESRRSDR